MSAFTNNQITMTSLKLTFNGEIRRLSVPSQGLTYQNLMMKTLSVFPRLSSLQFSWVDDENDTVVISSNEELSEALRIMATEEEKGYLRFEVLTAPAIAFEKSITGTITHAGIMCNECAIYPLVGPRYKCSIRANYNLCEPCEGLVSQEPYPTLKIYRPEQISADFDFKAFEKKKNWGGLRGGRCNGCNGDLAAGAPRFKCTVRKNFDLCEACERKDKHVHVMVKVYPQGSGGGSGGGRPRSRRGGGGGGRDSRRGQQEQGDKSKPSKGRGGRGRHCWDRTSVAAAAAKRAKQQAEETSRLDDAMLEMCIQESLSLVDQEQEQERMREYTAASSAAAITSTTLALSPASEPPAAGGGAGVGQSRGRGGRHCWDRASVTRAASMRAKLQAAVPVFGTGQQEEEEVPKAQQEEDSSCVHLKLLKMRTKQCRAEEHSLRTALHHLRAATPRDGIVKKQGVQWMIHSHKTGCDRKTDHKTDDMTDDKTDDSSSKPATKPAVDKISASVVKESVKWTISEETKEKEKKTSALACLTTQLPRKESEQHEEQKQQNQQCVTKADAEAATHASSWSQELQVLSDMGFSADRDQLLPLLQTHLVTPAAASSSSSSLRQGSSGEEDDEEGSVQQRQREEGMQAVVSALLSGGN